jgi:hypothetical protein
MKYQTISELEQGDHKQPIWALNGSAGSEVGQPGEVHVGIPKVNGSGKIDDLYLPQTWLPINLTDMIPRAQLLAASEFRNAVNNQLITLITKEFAQEILVQDGVEEERDRLTSLRRAVREATASRTIQQSGTDVINTSDMNDAISEQPKEDPNEIAPGFLMFADTLESKSDIEVLNLIRGRGKLLRKELNHLVKKVHDKPKTLAFLKGITKKN